MTPDAPAPDAQAINAAKTLMRDASRIVSFSGAGLSAESGVATFRDAQTRGLWLHHDPQRLASPQGFADDPELVIGWYNDRRRQVSDAAPNPAHRALAARRDIVNVTQNVDDLLERAGADAESVIHLHGRIGADRCHAACGFEETIDLAEPPSRRTCPECGAPVRPAVVWFGESLPDDAWADAERACAQCDVLLVVGTSAAVYPAAGLVGYARSHRAKIIVVNAEPITTNASPDVEIVGRAGEVLPELL